MKISSPLIAVFASLLSCVVHATVILSPTPFPEGEYQGALLEGSYDPAIPTPDSILGFPVGQRTATPAQIVEAITAWSAASERAIAVEYARTHEGRPLYYVMISSPENLARADEIQADLARLANPSGLSESEADAIIARTPAISWMAYSIHGNETSGADSALAAIYHLAASTSQDVQDLLANQIVLIDPSMNPDGRARFVRSLEQHRGVSPNVDDQSLLHSGFWPYGRTNHYFFDLNRDFFYLVHPETRGRVKAINQWHPQLIIDGHEMGSQGTFLFSPAREPVNRNLPPQMKKWGGIFARDQSDAFDTHAWPYYSGEWNDNLYAGYSSYAGFRGSLFILYEQARTAEDGIRLQQGTVRTYQESVHHQLVSTMANLTSLARYSKDMYRDNLADRRLVISSSSPYANISYAVLPTANNSRLQAFIERLQAQGIEILRADQDLAVHNATNMMGQSLPSTVLPAGTLIIPNRQAEARLLAAILEFDAKINDETLVAERQELFRDGDSTMYDTTAWNLEMMYGLETLRIPEFIDNGVSPYQASPLPPAVAGSASPIAWIADGADDASVGFAARLMEQGARVRAIDKAITLGDQSFSRGSVMVSVNDNRKFRGDLPALVEATAREMRLTATGIDEGLGSGDLPDIGGRHFVLLEQPRIAILSRDGISPYSFGAIWHSIDSHLGIRHSHLDQAGFSDSDLRRYNVLVLPHRYEGELSDSELSALKTWVEAGGTLVAIQGSVPALVAEKTELSSVRLISDTFTDPAKYDLSLQREWLARSDVLQDPDQLRAHVAAREVSYPWGKKDKDKDADEKALKKQDDWQAVFMPQGAMLAGQVDQKHWLTFGAAETLPVLYGNAPVLMSDDGSSAAVRMGVLEPVSSSGWKALIFDNEGENWKLGWATIPAGQDIQLRMSGLLWPEAGQRIANSAYLTRESRGHGQIILFAGQPVFRGATLGTNRLLLNALVYGPGLGAQMVVTP
jgi:hypothetical protein